MNPPSLAVVILNYNCASDVIECVRSIESCQEPSVSIYVVDNCSTDGSADRLREALPHHRVIFSVSNEGFSVGTNIGAREALADGAQWLLFLNPDTAVHREFFNNFFAFLERVPDARVAGGAGLYYADPDKVWFGGGFFSWMRGRGECSFQGCEVEVFSRIEGPQTCAFLTCACLFVESGVVRRVGLLDQRYFLGGEEWEYSRRIGRAGYLLYFLDNVRYRHKVTATHVKYSPKYIYNGYRTKLMFMRGERPLLFLAWRPLFRLFASLWATRRFRRMDPGLADRGQDVRSAIDRAFSDDKIYRSLELCHLEQFDD